MATNGFSPERATSTLTSNIRATTYVGLSSTTPAADRSNFTEPAASTGYARAQIGTINSSKSGQVANDEIIFCFEATAAVGQLTYLGLFDTKTGGKPFFTAELTRPISVAANTVPLIRKNQLVVALDKDAIEAY